jgi:cephalosporin-C deacetylase-like acetyl esterase
MRTAALCGLLLVGNLATARDDLNVLGDDLRGAPPKAMLSNHLLAEAGKHFDARRQTIADLKTPADVQRRRAALRAKFVEALGGFPEKTPLNARVVGQLRGDGFRVEKVIYESRPNHHVTAALYLPDGPGPFPGVLMPMGHSVNGKAAEYAQRGCILLAKNGLAALCYDPIGQGERRQLLDRQGKPAVPSSTSEHTLVGVGALLVGQSTATYRIWDGIRSLDYLASRPEIDPKRIGCTGCSGGGTLTSYLMALDDRIAVAAPSCYLTSLERLFATIGPQDAEQNITGQVAFGLDHADYIGLRAPKPTLICAATRDFFDIQGTWTTFREAKRLYGLLGHAERVDLVEYDTQHGYPKPQREAIARWMRRWLLGKDDAPTEGEFPIFTDAELQCTRTGQVLEEFKGKSAFDLNADRARELAGRRTQPNSPDVLAKQVRELIALPPTIRPAQVAEVAQVRRDGYRVRKLKFETESGITVPGLHFVPEKTGARPLILYVHGDGKATDAGPDGPIERLVKAGRSVLALDLRGWGETAPRRQQANRANYFGDDSKESFLALHLNRPVLGQRVYDLLAVTARMASEAEQGSEVIGCGNAGPVVLHAAILEPRIKRVTLDRSIVSWAAVVQSPITHNQLTNAVPGVLAAYDLPDLAAAVAPRPLTIRAAVDASGKPVTQAALEEAFAACRKTYDGLDPRRLMLKAEP